MMINLKWIYCCHLVTRKRRNSLFAILNPGTRKKWKNGPIHNINLLNLLTLKTEQNYSVEDITRIRIKNIWIHPPKSLNNTHISTKVR
jgi:hypothetical protein